MTQTQSYSPKNPFRRIIQAGLLVGLLDGAAALTHYYLASGKNPLRVFTYVASAVVGPDAYSGGWPMTALGVVCHFCVAISVVAIFTWLYRTFPLIGKYIVAAGLLYGLLVWLTMNLLVLPLTNVSRASFNPIQALIGILIHLFIVGLSTALLVQRYNRPISS